MSAPDDYAYGSREAAEKAWKPLADNMGCTVEEAAKRVLAFAAEKNARVASQLMKDYQMDPRNTVFDWRRRRRVYRRAAPGGNDGA